MKRLWVLAVLAALLLGLGLWLGSGLRQPSALAIQRASMNLELARTMFPFKIAFRILLGGIALFTLAGLGWGVVRWVNRRVDTLYADHAGLFPIREGRVGQAKVFHDPNRALSGTTVYADGKPDLTVHQPIPEGQEIAQHRVTAQAQAAQALRAAVSGFGTPSIPQTSPVDPTDKEWTNCRPLPEVQALEIEPSHIERLLLENGE